MKLRNEGKPNDLDEHYHELSNGYKVTSWVWNRLYKYVYQKIISLFLLFSYQKTGVHWLLKLHDEYVGGILADEMGLGNNKSKHF